MTQPPMNVPPVMPPPIAAPMYGATGHPATPRKGWFRRNLAWLIPVGCLTMLALAAAFVGVILCFVMGAIKTMGPYEEALSAARNNAEVVGALGTPIKGGCFIKGKVNVSGSHGYASFSFPISGPKGKGTVHVAANKSAGEWTFVRLEVEIDRKSVV